MDCAGDTGAVGAMGPTGPIGPTGLTGATGAAGPVGCASADYIMKSNGVSAACTQTPIYEDALNLRIGIGTTAPAYKLHIYNSDPATIINTFSQFNPTLTVNQAANLHATWSEINTASTFDFNCALWGAVNRINLLAAQTGSVTETYGSVNDSYNYGSGAVGNAYGSYHAVNNVSTGIVTNAFGLRSEISNSGAGSITNGYGLYVGTMQATNKWSIFSNDATAPSYFAGNVGIGTTTPGAKLDVRGDLFVGIPNIAHATIASYDGLYLYSDRANSGVSGGIYFGHDGSIAGAGTIDMTITNVGDVGIATTSPAEKLHVVGNIRSSNLAGTVNRPVYADPNGTLTTGIAPTSGYSLFDVQGVNATQEGSVTVDISGGTLSILGYNESAVFLGTWYTLNNVSSAKVVILITNDDDGNCGGTAKISTTRTYTVVNNGGGVNQSTDMGCNSSDGNNMTIFITYNPL